MSLSTYSLRQENVLENLQNSINEIKFSQNILTGKLPISKNINSDDIPQSNVAMLVSIQRDSLITEHKLGSQYLDEIKKELIKRADITLLDCIRYNPIHNTKIISLFCVFILSCSILISAIFKFHIVNPFFAIFSVISCIGYFMTARTEEKLRKKEKNS